MTFTLLPGVRALVMVPLMSCVVLTPVSTARAQDAPSTSADARESEAHRLALLGTGAVSAATWTQAIGMPDAWPRTWRGYGNRLGDQVGFTATEEVLRVGLVRATGWQSGPSDCPGALAGRAAWPRLRASVRCGVRGTFVAQNRMGAKRPNVPLLGAVAAATAVSLAWRPERKDAHKGQVFLLTRVGISLGASAIVRSVEAWRGK